MHASLGRRIRFGGTGKRSRRFGADDSFLAGASMTTRSALVGASGFFGCVFFRLVGAITLHLRPLSVPSSAKLMRAATDRGRAPLTTLI